MPTRPAPSRRRAWLRHASWLLPLAAVAAFAYPPWNPLRADAPPDLATQPVQRMDLEERITALGTLQPLRQVEVGTQVSGQLEKLFVETGDTVAAQQPLARIDPAQLQARVDAGRAGLRQLREQLRDRQAQAELAASQHERNRMLIAREFIAPSALQASVAAVASARAQVGALQAQIEQAQAQLAGDEAGLRTTRILAPIAGTVVSIHVREGQTVVASQSAPVLLRIADLSRMTVWAQVSEADVPSIQLGMPAEFSTLGLPQRRWRGAVRQVLPMPETVNNVVLYNVLFDVDNADGALRPQMSAQVSFVRARAPGALVVPMNALERQGKGHVLQVLGPGGVPQSRQVLVGLRSGPWAQVLAGVSEGEVVVVEDAGARAPSGRGQRKAGPARPAAAPRLL